MGNSSNSKMSSTGKNDDGQEYVDPLKVAPIEDPFEKADSKEIFESLTADVSTTSGKNKDTLEESATATTENNYDTFLAEAKEDEKKPAATTEKNEEPASDAVTVNVTTENIQELSIANPVATVATNNFSLEVTAANQMVERLTVVLDGYKKKLVDAELKLADTENVLAATEGDLEVARKQKDTAYALANWYAKWNTESASDLAKKEAEIQNLKAEHARSQKAETRSEKRKADKALGNYPVKK
jgi:hypothetical protein